MDARSRALYEHGRRSLESRFDPSLRLVRLEGGDVHDPRDSLWYALCLLLDGGERAALAEEIIAAVLSAQERNPRSPRRGNFRWFYEDETVEDLNAAEFVLERLVHILLRCGGRLSAGCRSAIEESMRLAFEEVERLDVHWTYANIYLLEVHNCLLGGRLLGDSRLVARGRRRLEEWAARTKAAGAPHEFNSPTYSAVQIVALAALAQFAPDAAVRDLALEMEAFLWRHVAARFHAPTLQLAGPHSRAYRRDVTGGVGFLKVLLYKLLGEERLLAPTPYYSGPGREGDIVVALTDFHCPPDALALLKEAGEREVRDTPANGQEAVTFITPEFALGTMAAPYRVGDPPEAWPQYNACTVHWVRDEPPGYGVLYTRYVANERRIGDLVYPAQRTAVDLWEEGVHRAAQSGPYAVVLYGTGPRGYRPVSSLRLDVRFLGPDPGAFVLPDGRTWDGAETELPALAPLVVADGRALIGVLPLEAERLSPDAPLLLRREGDETVLSVYNYRGPARSFWEYRTLGGPFFKGNLRNGVALCVARRSEFRSAEDFRSHMASLEVEDAAEGSLRRVRFASVAVECDLRTLRP